MMTLEDYLHREGMELSTFSKQYNLDYHRLYRVKKGAMTRDKAIKQVFEELGISHPSREKDVDGEPNMLFLSQERICISLESSGEIYCYYLHHLQQLEAYLTRYRIPYYVRQADDHWLVKYDKEARE